MGPQKGTALMYPLYTLLSAQNLLVACIPLKKGRLLHDMGSHAADVAKAPESMDTQSQHKPT